MKLSFWVVSLLIAAPALQHQHLGIVSEPAQTGMQAVRRTKRAAPGVARAEVNDTHANAE